MRSELRRRVYLSGMLLGVPMIMLGWVLRQDDAVLRFGYPVLALYLAVAALALLRRPGSLVAVERTTYWFITGTWMAMMAYRLARAPDVESAWWSLSPQVVTTHLIQPGRSWAGVQGLPSWSMRRAW